MHGITALIIHNSFQANLLKPEIKPSYFQSLDMYKINIYCQRLSVLTVREGEVFHSLTRNLYILHCLQQYYQEPTLP